MNSYNDIMNNYNDIMNNYNDIMNNYNDIMNNYNDNTSKFIRETITSDLHTQHTLHILKRIFFEMQDPGNSSYYCKKIRSLKCHLHSCQ